MSPDDTSKEAFERDRGRPRTVTELAVELTMAWLKRVESTADGREPKEVVQALDEFFAAIQRHQRSEAEAWERVGAH
ncbi:MAG TPA: hypothetical protein VF157_13295 [Chloroflexota bacterium]